MKGIKEIHFYEIVEVPHLLQRLSEDIDKPEICDAMCELLLNSFYPTSTDEKGNNSAIQIQRCLAFTKENELAATGFYKSLHHHVSIGSLSKFSVVLFQTIQNSLKDACGALSKRRRDDQDNSSNGPGLNESQCGKLLRILYSVLASIHENLRLKKYSTSLELLLKYLTSESIGSVFDYIACTESSQSLDLIPTLLKVYCLLKRVNNIPEGSSGIHLSSHVVFHHYAKCWENIDSTCMKSVRLYAVAVAELSLVNYEAGDDDSFLVISEVSISISSAASSYVGNCDSSHSEIPLLGAIELLAGVVEGENCDKVVGDEVLVL